MGGGREINKANFKHHLYIAFLKKKTHRKNKLTHFLRDERHFFRKNKISRPDGLVV